MKVYIEKDGNKIFLPEDFVSLDTVTPAGSFLYKFRYGVNLPELIKAVGDRRAYTVKISVIKDIPEILKANVFAQGFNSKAIMKNLQRQSSFQKDINRRELEKIVITKMSDITKKIPNDSLPALIAAIKNNFADIPGIKKYFSYSVLPIENLHAESLNAPVLEMNLNTSNREFEIDRTTSDIREESLNLIYKYFTDPAEFVCQKSNTIMPAFKQHSGVKGESSWFLQNRFNPNEAKTIEILIKSLLTENNVSSYSEIPGAEHANIITKIEDNKIEIEEAIELPKDSIPGDTFILSFELVNAKGIVMQKITEVVKHGQLVNLLQSPTLPPSMRIVSTGKHGRNLIQINQNDPLAVAVAVFKKTIQANTYNLSEDYRQIAVTNLNVSDGIQMIEDLDTSPNPVIYRAVAIGADGQKGSDFSSYVVQPKKTKNNLADDFVYKRPNYLILTNEIRETSNVLFVDNLPEEAIALDLYRRDLTIHGAWEKVGKSIPLKYQPERPIQISDNRLKKRRVYEYGCTLTYMDGAQLSAGNALVMEYNQIDTNIVDLNIENLKVDSNNADNADVQFDIRKNIILTETDTLKSLLEEQGVTEYDVNLEENKHKLSDLFFLRVSRTNMNNGQIEDFGVIDGTSFSDKVFGRIKNVSSIQANTRYKYEVSAYARAAETLLTNFTRSVDVRTTSYSLKPSKAYHPVTLNEGNIVSEAAYKKNHAHSQFTIGKVCDVKYISVNFGDRLPSILESKVARVNDKKIIISWSTQGENNKFDHFIITLDINGMRTIVGKTHGSGEKNNYQFIDNLDNGEHGPLTYIITPVFYDFTRGNEIHTSPILI